MSGQTAPQPSSDSSWPDSNRIPRTLPRLKNDRFAYEFLSPIDDSPDFHDPFSELSLFLAKKIKQELEQLGSAKKWSHKIQETLLARITPEFQKKFPQLRLGVAALKKTWEKIAYFAQQIQSQKGATLQDGKLNTCFFIKENLKQYAQIKSPYNLQPYHYAHQLSLKLGECMALIDGMRPNIDELTKMVWSLQRHLICGLPLQKISSPYDEYDKIDKLIVKTILELTAKEPLISQKELEYAVRESLHSLHELPSFASLEMMTANVSAILADKLYAASTFHTTFMADAKKAVLSFVKRQISLCRAATPPLQHADLVRRIIALYTLASQLPKNLEPDEIRSAIEATYPVRQRDLPQLPQAVYAFIAAESVLMKNDELCQCSAYAIESILEAYKEATLLPNLAGTEREILEIVVWKMLSEAEGILEKLPYRIGQKIDEELANILIDNPLQSFHELVHLTVQFFKRTKELTMVKKWSEIERKIHVWTQQGDMLLRWIHLSEETPLIKLILQMGQTGKKPQALANAVAIAYLKEHPTLAVFSPQLSTRVAILCKWAFYALFANADDSSYDCFLKWHAATMLSHSPQLTTDELLSKLEEISSKLLPLLPFDPAHCRSLLCA